MKQRDKYLKNFCETVYSVFFYEFVEEFQFRLKPGLKQQTVHRKTYLSLFDVIGLPVVKRLSSLRERSELPRSNLQSKHFAFYETSEGGGCFALEG